MLLLWKQKALASRKEFSKGIRVVYTKPWFDSTCRAQKASACGLYTIFSLSFHAMQFLHLHPGP